MGWTVAWCFGGGGEERRLVVTGEMVQKCVMWYSTSRRLNLELRRLNVDDELLGEMERVSAIRKADLWWGRGALETSQARRNSAGRIEGEGDGKSRGVMYRVAVGVKGKRRSLRCKCV